MASSVILTRQNAQEEAKKFAESISEYPNSFIGNGIITCAGSKLTLYNLYFLVKTLRYFGSKTPVECWFLEKEEIPYKLIEFYSPLNVSFVKASNFNLGGWELKSHAILNASYREVLFLDSDNLVDFNVDTLFDEKQDLFWSDFGYLHSHMKIFEYLDMKGKVLKCFEAAQFKINKEKSWKALNFSNWINQNSYFYYKQQIYGDKDTFNLAWNKLNIEYKLDTQMDKKEGIFFQPYKDKSFYHKNHAKKKDLSEFNPIIPIASLLNEWMQ